MLETIMKYELIYYGIGIATILGFFSKMVSYLTTKKLVKEAAEIQKSNHKLMRLVKAKFEHASMVSDKVQNIEAFVQKYLYEYKVLMLQLNTWRSLTIRNVWVIAALGTSGIIGSYRVEGMGETMFRYGSIAAICVVSLVCIYIMSDEKMKQDAVKNYMVEYLENVCVHRYEKASQKEQEMETDIVLEEEKVEEEIQFTEDTKSLDYRKEQEMRIRAILEEFLA